MGGITFSLGIYSSKCMVENCQFADQIATAIVLGATE
jgi:hypothetical protein